MKKTLIYVDTSVIGGCCDPEFQEWSLGLLRDFQSGRFSLFLSELIEAEIQDAPDEVKGVYEEFQKAALDILELTTEAANLADAYLSHDILPYNRTYVNHPASPVPPAVIRNYDRLLKVLFI